MSSYPRSRVHFEVEWGGTRTACTRVSGLEVAYDVMETRTGNSKEFADLKVPGRPRYPNIVLERPIEPGDNEFFQWINTINLDAVERRDVTISLLNEEHEPMMVWKAKNAFPVRHSGPELDATADDPATETLELTHEGLVVQSE